MAISQSSRTSLGTLGKHRKSDLQPLVDRVAAAIPIGRLVSSTVQVGPSLLRSPSRPSQSTLPWSLGSRHGSLNASTSVAGPSSGAGRSRLLVVTAWPRVARPLELGGLCITNLQLFGFALRMTWLWLQKLDDSRPWCSRAVSRLYFHGSGGRS